MFHHGANLASPSQVKTGSSGSRVAVSPSTQQKTMIGATKTAPAAAPASPKSNGDTKPSPRKGKAPPPPTRALPTTPSSISTSVPTIRNATDPPMSDEEKRNRVAYEILSTEEAYVLSLQNLFKFYIEPIKQNHLISEKKLSSIVGNLDQILFINQELLEGIKTRMGIWEKQDCIGDTMKKLLPFLRLYSQYYSGYHDANELLAKLMQKSALSEFLNKTREDNNILDMAALLIMPVQRVPRYKLLLEQLLKYTPSSHPDYNDLQICLKDVQEVADILNKGIGEKERFDFLLKLEKRLSGNVPRNIAQPHRVLIHEGELTKLCRKVPKKRYFFLFNDLLLYGEPSLLNITAGDDDKEKEIKISMSINLLIGQGKMEPIADSHTAKNAFQILSKEKSFVAWADTPEEKEFWVQKLQEASKSRDAIVHVGEKKTDGSFAPKWQNDAESDICPACLVKFTAFRRKHHCRKCGTLACGKCSEHKLELPGQGKQRVCESCWESSDAGKEEGEKKKSSKRAVGEKEGKEDPKENKEDKKPDPKKEEKEKKNEQKKEEKGKKNDLKKEEKEKKKAEKEKQKKEEKEKKAALDKKTSG